MKHIILALLLLSITACGDRPKREWTASTTLLSKAAGLKDCTLSTLSMDDSSERLHVVRCPNSDATATETVGGGDANDRTITVSTIDHHIPLNTDHTAELYPTVTEEQRLRFEAKERLDTAQRLYNELLTKHME
jgi:hypothetical protein